LTRPAERYRWSSYRSYVGGPCPVDWVDTSLVLGVFGSDTAAYRRYVEAGKGERPVSPFERAVAGVALGAEGFVEMIRAKVSPTEEHRELPSLRALRHLARPSPASIEAAVNEVFGGETDRHLISGVPHFPLALN
jgi:hypothetical protein